MCDDCRPWGGYWRWREAEGTRTAGLERCTCEDGARAAGAEERRKSGKALPPVLTVAEGTLLVEMLAAGVPSFFPSEAGGRTMIGDELRQMCHDWNDAENFVRSLSRRWKKWEGLAEMRRAYCASRVPLDAVMDDSVSEVYPDGYPPRQLDTPERAALAAAPSTKLLAGPVDEERSRFDRDTMCTGRDAQLQQGIQNLGEQKQLQPPPKRRLRDNGRL